MHRVLARGVTRAALVRLETGDRTQVDDVAVSSLAYQRQACARHAHETKHVDLPHLDPLFVPGLSDGIEATRETGVVDEHIDSAKLLLHLADESVNAFELGHIEGKSHA